MLVFKDLGMRFGKKILFDKVSLQLHSGNRYGLVGANGSGKSTLIRILVGEQTPDQGEVITVGSVRMGHLQQEHTYYEQSIIRDLVVRGNPRLWSALEKKRELIASSEFHATECEALEQAELILQQENGYAAPAEAGRILEGLGIACTFHDRPLRVLSGGYRLRVLLAQVLFGKPDLLILDEPTNHLDIASIWWLAEYLKKYPGTVIVTSHDREFLNYVVDHVLDVDYGTIKAYKGNYDAFVRQKESDVAWKEHFLEKQERKKENLQGFIDRFGAKASKARQANSKERLIAKLEEEMAAHALLPTSRVYPNFFFESIRPSGARVLRVNHLCKAYGDNQVLSDITFDIERGEKVALIGPNGVGKSTLLEILTQHRAADSGHFSWGHATHLAYFPQDHVREVQGKENLVDWLSKFDLESSQEKIRNILGAVLFSGDKVFQPVDTLSGGETARLLIAKIMLLRPNVFLLDEPTNHLDMEAIEELVDALAAYTGTVLFVSHNRYFVQKVASRIIEITAQGVADFRGGYLEYLEKQREDHLEAQAPKKREDRATSAGAYEQQKRLRNERSARVRKIDALEKRIALLEKESEKIDITMSQPDFYVSTSHIDQQQLVQEKERVMHELHETVALWEQLYAEDAGDE